MAVLPQWKGNPLHGMHFLEVGGGGWEGREVFQRGVGGGVFGYRGAEGCSCGVVFCE